jgi:hypothetical protein
MIPRYVENLRVMEETAPSFRDLQFIKVRVKPNPIFGTIINV